jgi:hypothetical protein
VEQGPDRTQGPHFDGSAESRALLPGPKTACPAQQQRQRLAHA